MAEHLPADGSYEWAPSPALHSIYFTIKLSLPGPLFSHFDLSSSLPGAVGRASKQPGGAELDDRFKIQFTFLTTTDL